MSEVDIIAQGAVLGEEMLRRKPVVPVTPQVAPQPAQPAAPQVAPQQPQTPANNFSVPEPVQDGANQQESKPKTKMTDRVRGIFGSMFD
ncbi:cell division protein FtsA [Streptococcus sobrinus DSM 20742 = ATCC 33478]|nr:cell division protein FtsA [Streptococcus sobrinus DSM 20742 = ATCC 33478]